MTVVPLACPAFSSLGTDSLSCGAILNSFYINVHGFFHKAANRTLVESYVQEERTYVRSRDYPNSSDRHGYPNKPIPMYCNSHLVPRLGGIKQKKCIVRCCALRRFFLFYSPKLRCQVWERESRYNVFLLIDFSCFFLDCGLFRVEKERDWTC